MKQRRSVCLREQTSSDGGKTAIKSLKMWPHCTRERTFFFMDGFLTSSLWVFFPHPHTHILSKLMTTNIPNSLHNSSPSDTVLSYPAEASLIPHPQNQWLAFVVDLQSLSFSRLSLSPPATCSILSSATSRQAMQRWRTTGSFYRKQTSHRYNKVYMCVYNII